MKTILKTATTILLSVALMCACSKPDDGKDGAKGDKGDKGEQGATGAQGPQGTPGNANVMMYTYGSKTITTSTTYEFPITFEEASNSQIYAYFISQGATAWRPAPGRLSIFYEVQCTYASKGDPQTGSMYASIFLHNFDGTFYNTPVTWDAFRIIVVPIPADNIIEVAGTLGAGSKGAALDYNNYEEVAAYYGLPTN